MFQNDGEIFAGTYQFLDTYMQLFRICFILNFEIGSMVDIDMHCVVCWIKQADGLSLLVSISQV